MALIDLDKFVASFITEIKKNHMVITYNIPSCIKKALEDQGLEYKGGEIVKISTKSEDERIRKALIDGFSNYYSAFSTFGKIKVENILAWLEKQGESPFDYENAKIIPKDFAPKPIWGDKDDSMFQSCIGAVATNDYYKGEEKEQIYDWLKSLKQRIGGSYDR